jgi:hypothetical protein
MRADLGQKVTKRSSSAAFAYRTRLCATSLSRPDTFDPGFSVARRIFRGFPVMGSRLLQLYLKRGSRPGYLHFEKGVRNSKENLCKGYGASSHRLEADPALPLGVGRATSDDKKATRCHVRRVWTLRGRRA